MPDPKFRTFCLQQTMRLESLGAFPFGDSSIIEIRNFLEEKSSGSEEKVFAVIQECLEMESRPTLPDVRRIWYRIHQPDVSHVGCKFCVGSGHPLGWITHVAIDRFGTSVTGMRRCTCGSYEPHEYQSPKDNPAAEKMRSVADLVKK
jgi:hypothetical protein